MFRGTIPTLMFTIDGVDLSGSTVYISISDSSRKNIWTWNNEDNKEIAINTTENGCTISMPPTQQETLALPPARVLAQVRWINADNEAMATDVTVLSIEDVLYQEVIAFRGKEDG